jgi:hypothetical protein
VEAEQQFDEAMAALDAAIAAAKAAGMSDAEITATGYWSKQRGHAA